MDLITLTLLLSITLSNLLFQLSKFSLLDAEIIIFVADQALTFLKAFLRETKKSNNKSFFLAGVYGIIAIMEIDKIFATEDSDSDKNSQQFYLRVFYFPIIMRLTLVA